MKISLSVFLLLKFFGFAVCNQFFRNNGDSIKSSDNFELTSEERYEIEKRTSCRTIRENIIHGSKSLKEFYDTEDTICKTGKKKYEDLVTTIDNYVQRYVSLFLVASNLRDYEIKDFNEIISMDLEISITGEDLIYLQGYSKSVKSSSYPKNFSKLDAIFSKIARLKERSFAEKAMKSSKSFFANFNFFSVFSNPVSYKFLSFLITILMTWLIHHYLFHKSFYVFVGLTINSLIFWEGLNEYWKKLKEAEVEIFVRTLEGVPEECNPANLRWYHSVMNFFREDRCLQYYKNISKTPAVEVSLLKCIIDTYGFYLIRTTARLYGASVRDILQEILAIWPEPVRSLVSLPYVPFFIIASALFILILFQKRLRLSFFGAAIEVGNPEAITRNKKPALTAGEMQKTVRMVRKLKPWTKSRFPKRLEGNLAKRKKIFLKPLKSDSAMSSQEHCSSSLEEFNDIENAT